MSRWLGSAALLHLRELLPSTGVLSIGGAGVYDGIFLVGMIAAFLTWRAPGRPSSQGLIST